MSKKFTFKDGSVNQEPSDNKLKEQTKNNTSFYNNYVSVFFKKYFIYTILIIFLFVLDYYYTSYKKINNVTKNIKEETLCVSQICFDNGLVTECMTFTEPTLVKLEVVKSITQNGYVYNFVKLKEQCQTTNVNYPRL